MIYIVHRFDRSGLSVPSTVGLFVGDNGSIETEVLSEYNALFPGSKILLNPRLDANVQVELGILVHRESASALKDCIDYAMDHLPRVPMAVGFYCVDERYLEVIARRDVSGWARRKRSVAWVVHWVRRSQRLWDVGGKIAWRLGFCWLARPGQMWRAGWTWTASALDQVILTLWEFKIGGFAADGQVVGVLEH